MARRQSTATKSRKPQRQQAAGPPAPRGGWFSARAIRETVESVVVAFILAFLFRTFEAEAFVIPTGSMAPTLLGAHKDLYCPECGYQYRGGASSEEDQYAQQRGRQGAGEPVIRVTCPMCRFTANVGPGHDHPTYPGDRILVSKFAYEFAEPRRWDVVVFKFPAEAQTNFIKRCVGLPGETLRIWHGDLYVKPAGGDKFGITRREPRELRAMAQIVYDNDYVVESMTKAGWPLRWQPWGKDVAAGGSWKSLDGGVSFSIAGEAKGIQWLRYRHFAPSLYDWQALGRGRVPRDEPKPLLITDFYGYDTSVERGRPVDQPQVLGLHWVGDLLVECELESADGKGAALLDLVKGGRHFRCELNCETGEATLSIDGLPNYRPKARTGARGAGSHHVAFANIDRQLVLWVDGAAVTFDGPTDYAPLGNEIPQSTPEDPLDLAPAGIGSQSAALSVNHIRLWRDIYYIATSNADGAAPSDYTGQSRQIAAMSYKQLLQFLSTPGQWAPAGQPSPFDERRDAIFSLKQDQFFMMGDNSPMSLDARMWNEKFVSRELLIGRALFVFWPHSFNRIPDTSIPFPFFPNFARMRFIR
jgi:signal peptidase I